MNDKGAEGSHDDIFQSTIPAFEDLRKTTDNLSHCSRYLHRDSLRALPEQESRTLPHEPASSTGPQEDVV